MSERLTVTIPGRSYDVIIGQGILGEIVSIVGAPEVVAVVTDADVAAMHLPRLQTWLEAIPARVETFAIPSGEASKSVATAESLWRWLSSVGAHRNDVLIALGGGVVGDLGGFVAASYHRGMPFVQVPTTLLAMVDAAIGGKTAVDIPEGKNLVGAFHQPRAVVCDTTLLQTLPDAAFNTGMAEVIKHGFIAGGSLYDWLRISHAQILQREPVALDKMVLDAARVKVDIVSEDETERGARMFLNYGHTLGHALEAAEGYTGHTHGEAVGVGMMFAAHLARDLGYADRVSEHAELIAAFDLPTGGATFAFDDVATAWKADKKYERGMRFVLLEDIGRPVVVSDIAEDALRRAYGSVR